MQKLQSEIEEIQGKNHTLEEDYEFEINKKNQNATEVGQILNSVNNLYGIAQKIAEDKGKKLHMHEKESEHDPDMVAHMIQKLEMSQDYVDDLFSVLKDIQKEYRWEDVRDAQDEAPAKGTAKHR